MPNIMTEKNELLRTAIHVALLDAKQPMSSRDLANHPDVRVLGLDMKAVSNQLYQLCEIKKKPFPIRRTFMTAASSPQKWGYYLGGVTPVIENAPPEKPKPADPPAPVSGAPEDFTFNPVEFAPVRPEPGDAKVTVPPGVKCITLTVGGVGIRIELT